jgi:phosphoribosylanthranilate isomerase
VTPKTVYKDQFSLLLSRGGLVKICGLRDPEHAAAAATAGADLIGFIFAPARRQVSATVARTCVEAARAAAVDRTLCAVGVFVDASPSEIAGIAQVAGLDAVQLHGTERPELIQSLPVPALKVLRPRPNSTSAAVINEINRYRSAVTPPVGFLVEGYSEHASGGAGARADWEIAAEVSAESPILLAGGLDPENVGAAVRLVRPLGVDVSSGVEIDGIKDSTLIAQFIRAARAAFLDETGRVPEPHVLSQR